MHQTEHDHITVADGAAILSESRWTTQRRIRSGQLRAELIGKTYMLRRTDVEALRDARMAAAS